MNDGIASRFPDVDGLGDARRAIAYLDAQAAMPFWRAIKKESLALLQLREGERALDVGCGTGEEVRAMAERVGGAGLAAGVDLSRALIGEARTRTPADRPVRFEIADATALPFERTAFHAVRVERTLQHLADPAAALKEMLRVAAPGARLVALEPDWDTLVIGGEPAGVSREISRLWFERIQSPAIGRRLPFEMRLLGVTEIRVRPRRSAIGSLAFLDQQIELRDLMAAGIAQGRIEKAEAERWWLDLKERDLAGRFSASVTYHLVSGKLSS